MSQAVRLPGQCGIAGADPCIVDTHRDSTDEDFEVLYPEDFNKRIRLSSQ